MACSQRMEWELPWIWHAHNTLFNSRIILGHMYLQLLHPRDVLSSPRDLFRSLYGLRWVWRTFRIERDKLRKKSLGSVSSRLKDWGCSAMASASLELNSTDPKIFLSSPGQKPKKSTDFSESEYLQGCKLISDAALHPLKTP